MGEGRGRIITSEESDYACKFFGYLRLETSHDFKIPPYGEYSSDRILEYSIDKAIYDKHATKKIEEIFTSLEDNSKTQGKVIIERISNTLHVFYHCALDRLLITYNNGGGYDPKNQYFKFNSDEEGSEKIANHILENREDKDMKRFVKSVVKNLSN